MWLGRAFHSGLVLLTGTWHLAPALIAQRLTGVRELFSHTQNDCLKRGISSLFLQQQFCFVALFETT